MKKLAVIELDTKSINLVLANYNEKGQFVVYERMNETIKLEVDPQNGNVKPIRVNEAIGVLEYYKKVITENKSETIICFCTPRVERIKNYLMLLEEIYNLTGYEFSAYGEAYINLVHLCSFHTIEVSKGLLVNIENNNTYIIKYNRKNIVESMVLDFGAETLAEMFENANLTPRERMDKMVAYCKEQLKACDFLDAEDGEYKFIGMGKSFVNIAKICRLGTKYSFNRDHNYELTQDVFSKSYKIIQDLDADKTKKIKGIGSDRADIVASGTAIIKALFDEFYISEFRVCATEIFEGVLYDYFSKTFGDKLYPEILTASLETCNYFYGDDTKVCERIYSIANDLFDELRVLHRFTKHHNRILKIASYMSLSGKRISYQNFEKNSLFVTQNSNIKGASHLEILLAGFVAGSQNLDEFDINQWLVHRDIITDESYMEVVKKLAVLVKIARLIVKISDAKHAICDVLGDNCILSVTTANGQAVNTNEIRSAVGDFKKAFKKNLQVL